jgi:OOP family OmpA-OmpF porin
MAVGAFSAQGADVAQSKDHPMVSRYAGSEILEYKAKEFDGYVLPLGRYENRNLKEKVALEGRLTRIHYIAPAGRSALEVFRNYEQALKAAGFGALFQCHDKDCGREFSFSLSPPSIMHHNQNDQKYLSTKLARPDGDIYVSVYTVAAYNTGGKSKDRVYTQLDVVETRPMQTAMVKVDADAMAREIAASGRVALYGIYFDTGKAEVKSESKPALDEIGKLLKRDASLKLLVVGHTDNAGSFDHNLDLSRRRAQSVAQALASQHGVDAARLKPWGVGYAAPIASNRAEDGRAKNRRVELVSQ